MNDEKRAIRREMLERRRVLSAEEARERSRAVIRRVRETEVFRKAETICLYWPVRNEVDVRPLMEDRPIYLPRICGGRMEFYRYEGENRLKSGLYDIPEPMSEEKLTPDAGTLIVMPGVAFTPGCDRLGYGGGYYDEYLSRCPETPTLAVGYDFQMTEDIPREAHDFRPRCVVTESNIYNIER